MPKRKSPAQLDREIREHLASEAKRIREGHIEREAKRAAAAPKSASIRIELNDSVYSPEDRGPEVHVITTKGDLGGSHYVAFDALKAAGLDPIGGDIIRVPFNGTGRAVLDRVDKVLRDAGVNVRRATY